MKLLLDTHALLWWLGDEARLGQHARSQISDPDNTVLISVASLWEIVVKVRVGKLQADIGEIEEAIARDDVLRLDIRLAHLAVLRGLPKHPDHLLIAQAISEDATFVSEDPHAARYAVRVLSCSDPAG